MKVKLESFELLYGGLLLPLSWLTLNASFWPYHTCLEVLWFQFKALAFIEFHFHSYFWIFYIFFMRLLNSSQELERATHFLLSFFVLDLWIWFLFIDLKFSFTFGLRSAWWRATNQPIIIIIKITYLKSLINIRFRLQMKLRYALTIQRFGNLNVRLFLWTLNATFFLFYMILTGFQCLMWRGGLLL